MNTEELARFVSDAFEKAKAGQAISMYQTILPYFEAGALPTRSHYAFGWIIYYALHQSPTPAIGERKQMLARYLRLTLTKPHKLHSMILLEAIRLSKDSDEMAYSSYKKSPAQRERDRSSFSIVAFTPLWNLVNLREGDWRRKEQEGKLMNSTVEKFITQYVGELERTRRLPAPEFEDVMEKGLGLYSDSYNLLAQAAIIKELKGDKEGSGQLLRKAIIAAPTKFYLWSRLAALIDSSRYPRLCLGLLYKGLLCPGPEEFKGKIRLCLARILAKEGAYPQARHELQQVKRTYAANSWHLPKIYQEIESQIPEDTIAIDPAGLYRSLEGLAERFIYSSLPAVEVIKNYHKEASTGPDRFGNNRRKPAAWRVGDKEGENYWFTPRQFGIDENLPIGTTLTVKINNGKIVTAALGTPPGSHGASD